MIRAWQSVKALSKRDVRWITLGAALGIVLLAAGAGYVAYGVPAGTPVVAKASPSPSPSPEAPKQKPAHVIGEDRVVSLWTRDGLGHACPINSTDALTADHVAVSREVVWGPFSGFAPYVIWGDQLGNTGTAQWQWSDKRRDLSLIRIVKDSPPFTAYLRRAKAAPRVGDNVFVVGFKWGKGVGDWTNESKVSGVQAGMLIYETSPGPGSSGSCVLNEAGEVVAINVWTISGEGAGLLVVGEWAEVPDQFLEGAR